MGGVGLLGDAGKPRPLVGQLIKGKYRLMYELATGSLGGLYLAEQRGTGTRLVVKVFRMEFAKDNDLAEKLRRQMLAVAALSEKHPNIVRVYDCDQTENGSPFIAMEQLTGRTLHEVMREAGPLEMGRALSLAGQMAAGLNAAHDADIVHTDVHPRNFMVLGKGEAIKIIGFERARLRNVGAMDHLGPASGISRTPEYMAPEQIQIQRGRRGDITHQTDIYAFGVVLYEMLTGTVPFQASTPDGVWAMHLHKVPTPVKALRPEIPVEMEAKVLQALEKEPKWRENTANEVVDELLRGVAPGRSRAREAPNRGPQTIQTERGMRSNAPKRRWVRARWELAAISGLLILIAAAAAWLLYPRRVPEVTYQQPAQQRPKEALERGPATVGESKEEATENPPASKSQPPPVPVLKKTAPSASPAKQADTKPSQRIRPPAPPASTAPDTQTGSPDPSEIIDWLLKQPGAARP